MRTPPRLRAHDRALLAVIAAMALILTLAQCSSTPTLPRELTIQPGDLVAVTYRQSEGQDLVLRTLGNETREAIYSGAHRNVNAKVCEAVDMQPLLDVFAEYGFFRRAADQAEAGGAAAVSVSVNGAVRTWVRPDISRATTPAQAKVITGEVRDFGQCMSYFTTVYNGIQGYASMNVSSEQEIRRQERLLEEMRRKHKIDQRDGDPERLREDRRP